MKNILLILLISILTLTNSTAFSQQNKLNPLEKRFKKLESILNNTYPPIKKNQFELTIFSNKRCGRCDHLLKLLRKKHIPFIVYDLKIQKNGNLMRKLCYKKAGKQNVGIMYPVVIINDNINFKIKNIPEFVKQIETKYISIK